MKSKYIQFTGGELYLQAAGERTPKIEILGYAGGRMRIKEDK